MNQQVREKLVAGPSLNDSDLADLIESRLRRVPFMPEVVEGISYEETVFCSRLVEIADVFQDFGIQLEYFFIYSSSKVAFELPHIVSVAGIQVKFYDDFERLDNMDSDDGMFMVTVDAAHPVMSWIFGFHGFLYSKPTTKSFWEMRWTFQIIDGMPSDQSIAAASKLDC